jgi:hypothetical protein
MSTRNPIPGSLRIPYFDRRRRFDLRVAFQTHRRCRKRDSIALRTAALPDGSLDVVLRGEKQDGTMELVNLAAAASRAHPELPLPLLDGTPDRSNDAAMVALVENSRQKDAK